MILGSYNSEAATEGVLENDVLNPILDEGEFFSSRHVDFSKLRKIRKSYEFETFSLFIKIV